MFVIIISLLVALPDAVNLCLWQLLGQEADKDDNGESSDHCDGATIDGVERSVFAQEHIDHCETHTPDEACPDRGCGYATPVEA